MTVLVTGGLGFIGSKLADQLLDAGHEVVVFDPGGDTTILERYGIEEDVTIIAADVTESTDVVRTVRECDVTHVLHLAALLPERAAENPRAAAEVNVVGANNVLEAARLFDDRVDRVVLASSETVYAPDTEYDGPVDTTDLQRPDGVYSAAKLYNEQQAALYADRYDVNSVSLRPTGVYGPYRDSSEGCPELFEAAALGGSVTVADSGEPRSWLHVSDAARAFRAAAFADESALSRRVYNVRGAVATVGDVVRVVRRLVPDVEVTVETVDAHLTAAQNLDLSATRADLEFDFEYDLETFVREYVNALRADAGQDPL